MNESRSYSDNGERLVCSICGEEFDKEEIFPIDGHLYTARKAVRLHIDNEHSGKLEQLLAQDNRYLSLTDNQKELLRMMYGGLSDNDIAQKTGVSPSTVRHQRFVLREKAKSAAAYLEVWSLVEKQSSKPKTEPSKKLSIHEGATMVDDRYNITEEESRKIIDNVFSSLDPLKLKVFSSKEKKKVVILRTIAATFTPGRQYTEPELNEQLAAIYDDYATVRRYLIEYGFMERKKDCSLYWLTEQKPD